MSSPTGRFVRCHLPLLLLALNRSSAWSIICNHRALNARQCVPRSSTAIHSTSGVHGDGESYPESAQTSTISRRDGIKRMITATSFLATAVATQTLSIQPANAYTPDADPLRESLYLMSRVQEATVLQERFVTNAKQQDVLKSKMKLTLRLVEKNYRLLDQITFASEYVTPSSKIVEATNAGYESAEALQNAIDYVNSDLGSGDFEGGQKEYLTSDLAECRERLFDFMAYMPPEKLAGARKRVEEENVSNREEFDDDIDANAGVYNPVVLPWKNR